MMQRPAVLVSEEPLLIEHDLLEGAHETHPFGDGVQEAFKFDIGFVRLSFGYVPDEGHDQSIFIFFGQLDAFFPGIQLLKQG